MISASTLSCYSALSSRILITNRLITFLTLHSRYPVLQPINTYHSLIGAVYVKLKLFHFTVHLGPFTFILPARFTPYYTNLHSNELSSAM